MKNSFKILALLSVLFLSNRLFAQQAGLIELHIGDQMPDIKISRIYNDTTKIVSIRDLNHGKLMILDFWGSWCGACITGFKHLSEVRKEFGEKIEVVAVGYEPYAKIDGFFKRHPDLLAGSDIVLTNEKVLTWKLFPHRLLPHMAWVDKNGKVIAITSEEDVNAENIKNALQGKPIDAPEKKDASAGTGVIFLPFRIMDTTFIGRSIFTKHVNGYPSFDGMQGATSEEPTKLTRVFLCNETIRDLYTYALFREHISSLNFSRVLIETKDSLKFVDPSYAPQSYKNSKYKRRGDWEKDNLYCYELKVPQRTEDTILRKRMLADLNLNLNLNGRYIAKNVNCFKLTYQRPLQQNVKRVIDSLVALKRKPGVIKQITNVKNLVDFLNAGIDKDQVVDETKLPADFKLDILLPPGLVTYAKFNNLIENYGFHLEPVKRTIPVFVISENL